MLKNILKKRKESGFTIIEVLIVLAIAGLILVIVLIAIPQLQRNQRNEARKNDAARVATAVSNWMANNNGQEVPTTNPARDTAIGIIEDDLGSLGQYDTASSEAIQIVPRATVGATVINTLTEIRVIPEAQCVSGGVAGAVADGASRQFAVQYGTETSNGVGAQCLAI